MKPRELSFPVLAFFFLSIILILFGMISGFRLLSYVEFVSLNRNDELLSDAVRSAAIYAMGFGGMVVCGIGILVILLLHMFRKSEKMHQEAKELRLRNDAMEELNRQTKTLAHHQRLEMLGTLTSSIAHEFNNLLTPIMGYSLMALEKLPPNEEELYDHLLEVYNASRTAKTLISRLSDLSRKNTDDSFRMSSADEIIQKSLDIAAPAKPESVDIKLDLNCQEQRFRANEIQISQLLLNLYLNAFHAMESEGGIMTIETYFDEEMVFIRVSDTGCGIPKDQLGKIFDPFFSTKEAGKGTGLGLAIAAQVVEDHKGRIQVESQLGVGTSFLISLPRT